MELPPPRKSLTWSTTIEILGSTSLVVYMIRSDINNPTGLAALAPASSKES
jgi:hypothetical protein